MILLALIPAQVLALAALLVIIAGARTVLRSAPLAVLVVAPMAALVPWTIPGGQSMAAFSLAAALVWVAWLYTARSSQTAKTSAVIAAVAFAALLSPQGLILTGVMSIDLARRRRWKLVAAALGAPLAALLLLAVALEPDTLSPGRWPGALGSAFTGSWAAPGWYGALLRKNFELMHALYSRGYIWPMLLSTGVLVYLSRRQWWCAPTALWGGALLAGAVILGRDSDALYSLPIQMALTVPAGIAALALVAAREDSPAAACDGGA